ncbi:MAG TPA: hypothetical protein VN736_13910 [Candidatus Limnocylindrales bacterium]|nr:hypothetical protein [Candidatus Limnocylindrales bacterium]
MSFTVPVCHFHSIRRCCGELNSHADRRQTLRPNLRRRATDCVGLGAQCRKVLIPNRVVHQPQTARSIALKIGNHLGNNGAVAGRGEVPQSVR